MAVDGPYDDGAREAKPEVRPDRGGPGADGNAVPTGPAEPRTRAEYYEVLRAADNGSRQRDENHPKQIPKRITVEMAKRIIVQIPEWITVEIAERITAQMAKRITVEMAKRITVQMAKRITAEIAKRNVPVGTPWTPRTVRRWTRFASLPNG